MIINVFQEYHNKLSVCLLGALDHSLNNCLQSNRRVHLEKKHFYLDEAIGKPYGTTWEVCGNNLQLISPDCEEDEDAQGELMN